MKTLAEVLVAAGDGVLMRRSAEPEAPIGVVLAEPKDSYSSQPKGVMSWGCVAMAVVSRLTLR
jgi:hypothetical protein